MKTTLIGIDCATKEDKVGIALGQLSGESCQIDNVLVCSKESPLEYTLTQWILDGGRVLLAFDAPLGWPQPMGFTLKEHSAGQPIPVSGNLLFRRNTDLFIKAEIGQQSLDVGADRIARTALAALKLLANLRDALHEEVPLAWTPDFAHRVAAIEVYPAATLKARGLSPRGYKAVSDLEARRNIISKIRDEVELHVNVSLLERHADVLDAVICVCAAADFLTGRALQPTDRSLAEKEGWIWVRHPAL